MVVGFCAAVVAGCGGSRATSAVRIAVRPAVGLADQARAIVVSHLHSGEVVELTARTARSSGVWLASAAFRADRDGKVDLTHAAPLSGSYRGVSPMGLFWSQHQVGSGAGSTTATATTLTVTAGKKQLASAHITQVLAGLGVSEHEERVAQVGFYGEYFTPMGNGRSPAVVLWGGSEGGVSTTLPHAALLASHGIPALALAYFDEPGLPCSLADIPLEYFQRAVRWLRSQPQVDPGRVWVMSGSRGSEAALLVAAHWPDLVHGVIASAPSSEVYQSYPGQCTSQVRAAWTLGGRPLTYAPTVSADLAYHPNESVSAAPSFLGGLNAPAARAARIPVWKIKGPVMLLSGGDDQLWPSETYAARIMASLRADPSAHVHLNYPAAGHIVLAIPYTPTLTEQLLPNGQTELLGGTPATNDAANQSDWPAAIDFIKSH